MKATFLNLGKIMLITLSAITFLSACESPTQTQLGSLTGVNSSADATPTPVIGPPQTIQVFGGNGQTSVNGQQLANPITAKVTDSNGNPVSGVVVTFAVTGGGGIITTTNPATTDSGGQVSATVILGATVGTQTFSATMPTGTTKTVTFTETSTAQSTSLRIYQRTGADCLTGAVAVGSTPLFIGDVLNLCAVLVNASNLIVSEVSATWWTTGTLSPSDLSFAVANPGNYSSFSPTLASTGTINALVTDSIVIAANNITSTSAATGTILNSLPLNPDSISIVSGNAQSGQVGTNLAQPLTVKVVNVANAPVPGVNVTFTVSGGGGSIVTAQPVQTNSSGIATTTVKLGGTVGAAAQSFTATMPTGTSKTALFIATGTNGGSDHLTFTQQPSGANSGSAFSFQPILQVRDSYGNVNVSDNSTVVTLTVNTGTGALAGTLTQTAVNGVVTFTNVSYNTAESGVSLHANAPSLPIPSANSSSFTVGQIIVAAQCAVNGGGWNSTDGGCKDYTSGIVWSATSGSSMNWYQAVWDDTVSGSTPQEPWEVARGIHSDTYNSSGYIPSTGYDQVAGAYCHDLVESGYSDWRVPTLNEANQANTDGAATSLKGVGAWMWTGTINSPGVSYIWLGGSVTNQVNTVSYVVKCVRQPPPTNLAIATSVSGGANGLGVNVPFTNQPVIRIADSTNSTTQNSTNLVTLTVTTGTGLLCTTNTATGVTSNCSTTKSVNAVNGIATFSSLSYSKAETGVVLTASSAGLTSAALPAFDVNQTYPKAACKSVGGLWLNAVGGCKDFSTGLIYSSAAPSTMTWFDAIWDQASASVPPPTNAGTADSNDNAVNDYDPFYPALTGVDQTTTNYCHSLSESGQNDWFVPSESSSYYVQDSLGKQLGTYLNLPVNTYYWTAATYQSSDAYAYIGGTYGGGYWTYATKTSSYGVFCQRRDPPTNIAIVQQPAYPASCTFSGYYGTSPTFNSNCAGAGVQFSTQPIIKVVDADGAGPLAFDTSTITLTVVPASDATGGTGRLFKYGTGASANKIVKAYTSISMNATNGLATFAGLAYEKPNEKFRLQVTGTITWHGVVHNFGPLYTNDLQTAATYAPTQCSSANGTYVTELGGCHNKNSGGLVWANAPGSYGLNWSQMIWDSANGDPRKVLASDGVTLEPLTTDMDPVNAVGVGTDGDPMDVCHRMYLNGYYDWRMPTDAEMQSQYSNAGNNMAGNQLYGLGGAYIFSSKTDPGNSSNTYMYDSPTYSTAGAGYGSYTKNYTATHTLCVRSPNASSLYMLPNIP